MLWGLSGKVNGFGFGKFGEEMMCGNGMRMGMGMGNVVVNVINGSSYCFIVERLYVWEKKLFFEVKVFIFKFFCNNILVF